MKRAWMLILMLPVSIFPQKDIQIQRKPQGRIEIRNTLSKPAQAVSHAKEKTTRTSLTGELFRKIRELAARYQIDESLVRAVAGAESGYNPYAVSPKGAVGIMQLMPDTARLYGVKNRFNVDENLEAGIRHLKYLKGRYNGNLSLVLAAYNAGEEAVRKYNGIPPYRETRQYIRRVMQLMGRVFSGGGSIRSTLYKVITSEGRILITNTPPPRNAGKIEVLK
ncbi:MAG: lytic transglycosylase domain-containing protein [Acidobacteriota bacterium]|jgi:soluble lytic murein transglycosylase-like protein|nr:lytic transglycosylase domain-containing protein [Acidobacteriota bacterium]